MARIPTASRESVPPEQLAAFDEYVAGRGGVPESGPMSVLIHVPELIRRGEHLRAYLRGDESSLPASIRELGMLVAAREMDCQFIWHAHAALGRQAGLSDALIDNLRDHKDLPELSPAEAAVIAYGREFFRTRRVAEGTFNAALAQFGARGLVELTNLMGYYACLAFNINAFEVAIPADTPEPPLPV